MFLHGILAYQGWVMKFGSLLLKQKNKHDCGPIAVLQITSLFGHQPESFHMTVVEDLEDSLAVRKNASQN